MPLVVLPMLTRLSRADVPVPITRGVVQIEVTHPTLTVIVQVAVT